MEHTTTQKAVLHTPYVNNPGFGINSRLTIGDSRETLKTGRFVSKDLDATRGFKVRAAHDEKNVLVRFEVTSPSELINAATDPKLLFKGGNCLDIQLATDPAADPKRKTHVPGDLCGFWSRGSSTPAAVKPSRLPCSIVPRSRLSKANRSS